MIIQQQSHQVTQLLCSGYMWFEEAQIVGNLVLSADDLARVDLLTHLNLVFEAQCAPVKNSTT